MGKRVCLTLLGAAFFSAFAGKQADDSRQFLRQIPRDQRVTQALNRLTFGPRPDDLERVRAIGLKKWIDRQLHPEQISENPVLLEKLKFMDTLTMSTEELMLSYPTPQIVRQMVAGQVPFPSDPERRRMIQRLVERAQKKSGAQSSSNLPEVPALSDLLTPQEIRTMRTGTPVERREFLKSLAPDKRDAVIAALGGGMRQQIYAAASPELRRKLDLAGGPQQLVARDLAESKLLRAILSNRQLEEILADFWFNHFNIYLDKGADRYLVTQYEREVIRPHVLGKFRDLLEATAKSPAMLFYLDNWQSAGQDALPARGPDKLPRRGLNENYGRELLELHTLGVDGGYTQKDVTETARCFTGWTIVQPRRGGEFFFNRRLHDAGEKTVLGATIPAGGGIEDGLKVIGIVSRHPSTARFISRQLAQRFVADEPPPSLVDRMAQTFLKTDGDLREVMRTLINSKEFWSVGAYRTKMKSPLEMVASAVRAVNGDVDFAFALVNQIAQLGEPLYRKQEPTGYSNSSQAWLNSGGLLARMNFALQLAGGKVPGVKVGSDMEGIEIGGPDFQMH